MSHIHLPNAHTGFALIIQRDTDVELPGIMYVDHPRGVIDSPELCTQFFAPHQGNNLYFINFQIINGHR